VLAAVLLVAPGCRDRNANPFPSVEGTAKHVILVVGDGMQLAHEIALSRYQHGVDRGLSWHALAYETVCTTWDVTTHDRYAWARGAGRYDATSFDPAVGYDPAFGGVWTYDGFWEPPSDAYFLTPLAGWGGLGAGIPATDSAAAATALACGRKTDAGNVCWAAGDPPGGALASIGEEAARQKSMAYGVVTTVPFVHATPACFISHAPDRFAYGAISREAIHVTRPDVMIGAGHPAWSGHFGYIDPDDYAGFRAGVAAPYSEYVFVERAAGRDGGLALAAAVGEILDPAHPHHGRKLFGLFGGPGDYLEHPAPSDTPGVPGFTWPPGGEENPSLAECAVGALRVLEKRGGDHGFFLLIEGGDIDWANHAADYAWMVGAMHQLDEAVKAVVSYVDDPATALGWENTLLIVTADHANGYMRFDPARVLGRGDLPAQQPGVPPTYPGGEVAYRAPGAHTNEPVTIHAAGTGARLFLEYEGLHHRFTRLIDNTMVFEVMRRAMGLSPPAFVRAAAAPGRQGANEGRPTFQVRRP